MTPPGELTPGEEWGNELKRAVEARGMTLSGLGRDIGCGESTVVGWAMGRNLARYDLAIAASECLRWPELKRMIVRFRTRKCHRCGAKVIRTGNGGHDPQEPVVYCGKRCKNQYHKSKKTKTLHKRTGRLLALWVDTGDRMCRQWCPSQQWNPTPGLCPDASCPIQQMGFCPFPVAKDAAA